MNSEQQDDPSLRLRVTAPTMQEAILYSCRLAPYLTEKNHAVSILAPKTDLEGISPGVMDRWLVDNNLRWDSIYFDTVKEVPSYLWWECIRLLILSEKFLDWPTPDEGPIYEHLVCFEDELDEHAIKTICAEAWSGKHKMSAFRETPVARISVSEAIRCFEKYYRKVSFILPNGSIPCVIFPSFTKAKYVKAFLGFPEWASMDDGFPREWLPKRYKQILFHYWPRVDLNLRYWLPPGPILFELDFE